jgi:hypothetical protein
MEFPSLLYFFFCSMSIGVIFATIGSEEAKLIGLFVRGKIWP